MKYFEASLILFTLVASIFIWVYMKRILKRRFYQSTLIRKMSEYCQNDEGMVFFSTYIIHRVVNLILKAPEKEQNQILRDICHGQFDYAKNWLIRHDKVLARGFKAHFNPMKAREELENESKLSSDEALVLASIYALKFDYDSLRSVLNLLHEVKLNRSQRAWRKLLLARLNLYDGDMQSAAINAQSAVKSFNRERQYREEADGYFLLGEIYRACAVFDTAQMMYETALQIFCNCGYLAGKAQVLAAEGMLLSSQERFAEAGEKFSESRKIYQSLKRNVNEAEVINQLALLRLLQNQCAVANKYATQALKIHEKFENKAGQAMSLDLMGVIARRQKKYTQAVELASNAKELYLQNNNYSAYLEAAYLEAETRFKLKQYAPAAKLCRKIIKIATASRTCFHVANAFSLLGLIYLEQKEFKRAKIWFNKSLQEEKLNSRYIGIAADFSNLSKVENSCGNQKKAIEYLGEALKAAQQAQDIELERIIIGQIKKIS